MTAWLAWHENVLYFAAQVTDDRHHARYDSENSFWNSDSIQLAIDPWNDSTVGFDEDDREVGLVLSSAGPRAFLTFPKPHRVLSYDHHSARVDNVTTYEAAFPWRTLGQKPPRAGRVMAINFIVNENDGQGRSYWMGLTPGIGRGKSPKQYEEFLLVGERQP